MATSFNSALPKILLLAWAFLTQLPSQSKLLLLSIVVSGVVQQAGSIMKLWIVLRFDPSSDWSCWCWSPSYQCRHFLLFLGSLGCTQHQGAAKCQKKDSVVVGLVIDLGPISIFPGPWGLADCGLTLWMTAWRIGGNTGVPVGGLGDSGHLVLSSGMPLAPAEWGNNRLRNQS